MARSRLKIAFLQDIFYDHLGALSLISYLNSRGHTARLFIKNRSYDSDLRKFAPDLFAFSVTTGVHRGALAEAARLKRINAAIPVILGGPHATHFPEVIENEGIDYICRGEGEQALAELADRLAAGEDTTDIANLWVKTPEGIIRNEVRPLIEDLDSLPFTDRSHYDRYPLLKNNHFRLFISGRGCPFSCRHCHNKSLQRLYQGKGRLYRKRSVEKVCEEIAAVKDKYGLQAVDFCDDIFSLDRKWLARFAQVYPRRVGLPFACNFRADNVDREIAEYLKEAGCRAVLIGVESGSDKLRNGLLGKNVPDQKLLDCAEIFHKCDIAIQTTNMLGLPGETLEQGLETVKINRQMGTDLPWCSVLQPYPRTELADELIANGDIPANPDDFSYTFFKGSPLKQKDIDKLVNLHKFFYYMVRYPAIEPLVLKLIKLPPNPLFEMVFATSFLLHYKRKSRLGMGVILRQGFSLATHLLLDKNRSALKSNDEN
jgi:radical SAM superfamily enzyme YgiQ (UPF0313 family)